MKFNKNWCSVAAILITQYFSTGAMAMDQDAIIRRLDALERENNALKQRLSKVEHTAPKSKNYVSEQSSVRNDVTQHNAKRIIAPNVDPALDTPDVNTVASSAFAQNNPNSAAYSKRHFELSGSLLLLQPGSDNLTYGTRASPFPVPTPNWNDQTISPSYQPTFNIGFRYMPNEANDLDVNWTHLNTSANAGIAVNPITQFVGPSFYVGPPGSNYGSGQGYATFAYDAVRIEGGHTFCPECDFQFRPFAGVEFANINNSITGNFSNATGAEVNSGGLNYLSSTVTSKYIGAGPRAGIQTTYNWNDIQLTSKFGAGALIGTQQSNFGIMTTCTVGCPAERTLGPLVGNIQSWNTPGNTQVVPTVDTKLAAAYAFAPTSYGQFKVELGYQAALYFNVSTQYHLTNVPPQLQTSAPSGIYLATGDRTQNNFFVQGPYISGKWAY